MEQMIEVRHCFGIGAAEAREALLRAILPADQEESLVLSWPASLGDHPQAVLILQVLSVARWRHGPGARRSGGSVRLGTLRDGRRWLRLGWSSGRPRAAWLISHGILILGWEKWHCSL